ncbi:MAG: hypothetical protein U0031_17680 [Thermomicrobiales bacterium]
MNAVNQAWISIGIASRPAAGESVPVDIWQLAWSETHCRVALIGRSHHGSIRANRGTTMIEELAREPRLDPARTVERILRSSDAVTETPLFVARIDAVTNSLTIAGLGPLTVSLCQNRVCRELLDAQGIAGGTLGAVRQLEVGLDDDWMLVVQASVGSNASDVRRILEMKRGMCPDMASLLARVDSLAPGASLLIAGPR